MASRYSSAGQGAVAGAQLGSAIGPTGALVGGALGALGGAVMGGPSETEEARLKRQQELQRRQELGTLGFTDEEINVRLGAAEGQAQQQMQADRQQQATLLGAQDLGAGSCARGQQAQAQREQTVMAQLANQVQQENLQKAAQQEAELAALQGSQIQQEEYDRQQALSGAMGAAQSAISSGMREEERTFNRQRLAALVGEDVAQQVLDQGDRAANFWGW